MAITSEIIGKLGGAEVEETPVSVYVTGSGKTQVFHTVNIPPGETWLVAVIGKGEVQSTSSDLLPRININGASSPQITGHFANAEVMTTSGDIVYESNSRHETGFTGHVYTVKM